MNNELLEALTKTKKKKQQKNKTKKKKKKSADCIQKPFW